jgi:drug/metabolite transporter (DMT)-like permease
LEPHVDAGGRAPRWAAPLAVALIWGVNVPVMKAALSAVHPFAFNALRLTLSALALGVADRLERRGRPAPPTPWLAVIGLGLLTSLLYQVLFVEGIARTSATHTGFLIASGPLWTALIARALGVERPGPRAWLALAVAFVGTCLVASAREGAGATLRGNLLLLLAMIAWALGTVLSRPVLSTFPATRLAFLFTCVALPGHWLLALPHVRTALAGLGLAGWSAVAYSGLLSTGIAYSLWNQSVLRIGPARTSALNNLVPLIALTLAWAFLGERPGGVQLAGGALVLAGIALLRRARAEPGAQRRSSRAA